MRILAGGKIHTGDGVVAILGVFDGVHAGHLALFQEAVSSKNRWRSSAVAVTFHPHPRTFVGGCGDNILLLTPPEEKMALIEDAGADYFWSIPFTHELANTGAKEFVLRYLVEALEVRHVVCGFNFTFGKGGAGKPADLLRFGQKYGFTLTVVPPVEVGGEVVSSTAVRKVLESGRPENVMDKLGRPYCVYGIVRPGDGRGKNIGLPTCNLSIPRDKFLPGNGVYAAFVRATLPQDAGNGKPVLLGEWAVVNVGTRPTFGGRDVRVEIHIPGFSGNLYGEKMQVFFGKRIREERAFADGFALKEQVEQDILEAEREAGFWFDGGKASFTVPGAYDRMLLPKVP